MKYPVLLSSAIMLMTSLSSCKLGDKKNDEGVGSDAAVKLITLDPGHFHAALVQKEMYQGMDSQVYVYAPGGTELEAHLALINQYNTRADKATHWDEKVYTGADFFEKMLGEKKGNVVVLSGNNRLKTEYIKKAIDAGFNVLGDKPMVIDYKDFDQLQQAFSEAEKKKLLLYDIMTERSEITNMLQKEFAHTPEVFGEFKKGSVSDPSVLIESVHFYYKYVSGKVLIRPTWFFDPLQQGEAITDVGTHLVDLVQWQCFPDQVIDYKKDVDILSSKTWSQPITQSQFKLITNHDSFPDFLKPYVRKDSVLDAHGNGEINYKLKDINVKTIIRWDYKATEGGDTHYSIFKGTKANLEVKQGKEEEFHPTLYITPVNANSSEFEATLQKSLEKINATYPGVTVEKAGKGYKVIIPEHYKVGHEAHFGEVMQRYLQFLKDKKLPDWEVPNMLAKYYTTTKALEMAEKK